MLPTFQVRTVSLREGIDFLFRVFFPPDESPQVIYPNGEGSQATREGAQGKCCSPSILSYCLLQIPMEKIVGGLGCTYIDMFTNVYIILI